MQSLLEFIQCLSPPSAHEDATEPRFRPVRRTSLLLLHSRNYAMTGRTSQTGRLRRPVYLHSLFSATILLRKLTPLSLSEINGIPSSTNKCCWMQCNRPVSVLGGERTRDYPDHNRGYRAQSPPTGVLDSQLQTAIANRQVRNSNYYRRGG